ncbi:MAG: PAS domain-containing sensor histidine kinase [Anaerovorax sp.]
MKKYTNLWAMGVILLVFSTALITGMGSGAYFIEFQMAFHGVNSVAWILVLRACAAIYSLPYKTYLDKYFVMVIMFAAILYTLQLPETIILLPLFFFQLLVLLEIGYLIIRKWKAKKTIRLFSFFIYILYCFLKIYIIQTVTNANYLELIFLDFAFLILVNFNFNILFIISAQHITKKREGYIYDLAEKAVDIVFYYSLYPYPEFTFISPSVEETVGYKQKDFYKNSKIHIELTHEEDREIIIRAFSPTSKERTKDFIRWQKKDGEYIYLEYHNNPIERDGKIVAVEGTLRDVTDSKLAEKEMIEAQKTQQLFLSYISHELKTPITYIMGYTEMLKKNMWQGEEERTEALDLIYSKATMLQKLVEDLFQLSKMEANQFSFEFVQVSAKELYESLDSVYSRDILAAGMEYDSSFDPKVTEDLEVLADMKRMEQVHSNILQNAIKYAGDSRKITFTCELNEEKRCIVFRIRDMGPGIKNEELSRIFEPFYRSEDTKKINKKGTGIGLAIAKQIMMAHSGTIYANSKKGNGSEFIYTIPIYQAYSRRK